jgi:protein-S-isoprenylcysteine O-methyltransferase Ste14
MDVRRLPPAVVTAPAPKPADPGHAGTATRPGGTRWLARIPLTLRMTVYGVSFLAGVLVGLPYLASRCDVAWPWLHIEAGPLVRTLGAALFAVLLAIYVYCSYVLSSRGRGGYVEFDPPQQFVAVGPYRWTRNPVAGSLCAMQLALALALSSTGVLLLFIVALPLAHAQVVLLEEPLLRKRFGAAYEDYLRRVPRWLPRRPPRHGSEEHA